MKKTALVTGYTGQDGTFLTKLLLAKGYVVVALCRRVSSEPPHRIRGFDFTDQIQTGQLVLVQGDLLSRRSLDRIISKYQPDEIYNLAAQSHVGTSFEQPEFTIQTDLIGVVNLIESLEICMQHNDWRMYQASTSEMFGDVSSGQIFHERSRIKPVSPYAIAKAGAHYYCKMKRSQGHFIACGILFNHESQIRGGDFVTQKIVKGVVDFIETGKSFALGNLESKRDWGFAGDYVEAMWLMLQQIEPDDFVVGTGESRSVRDFVEATIHNLPGTLRTIVWQGEGLAEVGLLNGTPMVTVSPEFHRPNDVNYLQANPEKAVDLLGWHRWTTFDDMVNIMVLAEIARRKK